MRAASPKCTFFVFWILLKVFFSPQWPMKTMSLSAILHTTLLLCPQNSATHSSLGYLIGFTVSSVNAFCMSRLHFCDSNIIHRFFCDTSPRLAVLHRLSQHRNGDFCFCTTLKMSLITIPFSYASILSTILKISSSSGRQKAFSICADFQNRFSWCLKINSQINYLSYLFMFIVLTTLLVMQFS